MLAKCFFGLDGARHVLATLAPADLLLLAKGETLLIVMPQPDGGQVHIMAIDHAATHQPCVDTTIPGIVIQLVINVPAAMLYTNGVRVISRSRHDESTVVTLMTVPSEEHAELAMDGVLPAVKVNDQRHRAIHALPSRN